MNNISQFLEQDNLELLWEVLLDELNINNSNTKLISNIRIIFESNINPFISKTNSNINIIDLNKQFLSQLVTAVNRLLPELKQEKNIKRINITNEETIEPYKIEDIQTANKNIFEKELEIKKLELENFMTPIKPKEVDFSYKNSEEKITGIESLIAEKMAERNYMIEEIKMSSYNNSNSQEWLKPKETSINIEKKDNRKIEENNISNISNVKYSENNNNFKKVSWEDENVNMEPNDIFKKLKKQINQSDSILNNISSAKNPSIIPNSEIVKQLNEMNLKIDNIYTIINTLSKTLEKQN
uniref:Uncharacterized protein n=1 Tax=viral metagenome TaxID=1070528 RepID=A0A6C0KPY6_9ZZZZ